MIQRKSSKVLRRIVVILLITIFSIGIIACSGDAITGSGGRGYTSVTDGGGSPDNPDNPGDTNNTGGNTNIGGDTPPSLPGDNPGDYYDLRVPFVVKTGFTNVSYKDTNKLNQLWFDQINRKGMNDGKVFAIKNRANDKGVNDFQNGNQDYYYFNENGDMVYKPDNTIIKKFIGAVITRYRDVKIERGTHLGLQNNTGSIMKDGITWSERKQNGKPLHTVGGLYANTLTTEQAKKKYLDGTYKQGVYDFVTYWHQVETFYNFWAAVNNIFERQYINPGFLEVFVMADYYYSLPSGCAAVHSYYPYYGVYNHYKEYSGHPGIYFTDKNMPYMTNYNLYLEQRPEWIMNQLNHTAEFTDHHRSWWFSFVPGKADVTGKSTSIKPIPTW